MSDNEIVKLTPDQEKFNLAQRIATGYSSSSMVPEQYRGNVPNVLIAMELAERIGSSVFAVMQKLYIVHGKPAFESTFLIATVNSCGRFTSIRYRFEGKEGDKEWGCRAVATDKSTGEDCVGPKVTIKMAKEEGWFDKKGSKWQTMPELMLTYRAAAFWTRIYAPELSMGMHTRDEIEDSKTIDIGPSTVTKRDDDGLSGIKDRLRETATDDCPPVDKEPDPKPESNQKNNYINPLEELHAIAKKKYGPRAKDALKLECTKNGYNYAKLTSEQIKSLIDSMNNS